MIKKLVRQMLAAQTVSALTVSLCLLIDNIMIGRFLGVGALAAYGLANPILLVIGALGSMLSAGVQVACSKSLGRGSQEETNVGYSSAIAVAAVFSIAFVLLVVCLRMPLARVMGANSAVLLADTGNYMAGFIIGAPASMGALILVPFLQMAGQTNLLIAAVLGMTIADVGLDLLSIFVFNGGMFGMGLASSLSYYIAMIIGGWYFLSRKCIFRFSPRRIKMDKIKELLKGGVPSVVGMAASVVLVFVLNKILMASGGDAAVAAFSVITAIGNASNCVSTGAGGVSLTLSSILYNEEDRTGLKDMFRHMLRHASLIGVCVAVLLIVFAPACVGLFIPAGGQSRDMAVLGLRIFALGIVPCCVNNAFRSSYQGTGRVVRMEIISLLEQLVFPLVAAFIFSRIFNVTGVWFYFILGELLTMAYILLSVWKKQQKVTFRTQDLLLLSDELGVPEKDLMESDLHNLDEVMEFSRQAEVFCRERGKNSRISNHLALCIEEMGSNIVTYGFGSNAKNHLSVRLQNKGNRMVLRFRDDCRAFDPVSHMPEQEGTDDIGIRLTMHMADEARYTYSLNLNNLTLVFLDS